VVVNPGCRGAGRSLPPGADKEAARKRKRAVFPLAETMIEEAVNGRQRGAGFDGCGTSE
jgi:hypothetical protein